MNGGYLLSRQMPTEPVEAENVVLDHHHNQIRSAREKNEKDEGEGAEKHKGMFKTSRKTIGWRCSNH